MKNLNPLKLTATVFMLCAMLVSCSKDPIVKTTPQLTKIEQDGNNYTSLAYNSDQTLSTLKEVEDSYTLTNLVITYGADKKPISAKTDGYKMNFVYTAGKLTTINFVADQGAAVMSYMDFTYKNNRLSETLISIVVNNQIVPTTKFKYTYYDNGDVKYITNLFFNSNNNLFDTMYYHYFEYDTMANPLKFAGEIFSGLSWNSSAHNIKKEMVYDADDNLVETLTSTYSYEPSSGFPLTVTILDKAVGSPDLTINKKYIYK